MTHELLYRSPNVKLQIYASALCPRGFEGNEEVESIHSFNPKFITDLLFEQHIITVRATKIVDRTSTYERLA